MEIGIVNRYSWHKNCGDFAEKNFYSNYFKNIGLSFRKVRKDKKGKKPDGYILNSKKKIAVAEIKLIKYQKRKSYTVQQVTIDETITSSIKGAKRQLKTISEPIPKIIYLLLDDTFAKFKSIMTATFGKWITTYQGSQVIYSGYSGLCDRFRKNNKMRDNLISAIICYKPSLKGYKIFIIRNNDSTTLPGRLLDKKHLVELWDYNNRELKKCLGEILCS